MGRFRSFPKLDANRVAVLGADAALIASLLNVERGLSRWEVDFVESIDRDVEAGVTLTLRQREIAEEIATRLGIAITARPTS